MKQSVILFIGVLLINQPLSCMQFPTSWEEESLLRAYDDPALICNMDLTYQRVAEQTSQQLNKMLSAFLKSYQSQDYRDFIPQQVGVLIEMTRLLESRITKQKELLENYDGTLNHLRELIARALRIFSSLLNELAPQASTSSEAELQSFLSVETHDPFEEKALIDPLLQKLELIINSLSVASAMRLD